MMTRLIWLSLGLYISSYCYCQPAEVARSSPVACTALANVDFSTIDGAPTQITSAEPVDPKQDSPAHCRVRGYVWPHVGFELLLPVAEWNGKFLEVGCGGSCGVLPQPSWGEWCPLHRGYACIASDTGHQSPGGSLDDSLWAYHDAQAQMDFGYRAVHVAAVAGKAVSQHYYGRAPKYSYFQGCSLGSQQGLVEAQRFPGDFNGIIGGGVWIGDTPSTMDFIWGARALRGPDGKSLLSRTDMQRVHQAVLARCDIDDGLKDGLISNPLKCKFDPAQLGCARGSKPGCLTDQQVDALKKVYAGPTTSAGVKLSFGGALPGGEQDWIIDPESTAGVGEWITSDGGVAVTEEWANTYFRWLVRPPEGGGWKVSDFDFDRDYQRFAEGARDSPIYETNPDLRRFKAAGGKLLLYLGWKEWADPRRAIDYYDTVERTMGGAMVTRDFFRLYLIPGANHCMGGEGPWAVDYLTYMEKWVEGGQVPDELIGAHISDRVTDLAGLRFPLARDIPVDFTRPIYPYPRWAKYKGHGDPDKAESFTAAGP